MEISQKQYTLETAMHYLAAITFIPVRAEPAIPAIGLVFGNPNIAGDCQRIAETLGNRQIRLTLKVGAVTGELTLENTATNRQLATGTVNVDQTEINLFRENTPETRACVLAFGFREACEFLICPATGEQGYHPILLSGFSIDSQ